MPLPAILRRPDAGAIPALPVTRADGTDKAVLMLRRAAA